MDDLAPFIVPFTPPIPLPHPSFRYIPNEPGLIQAPPDEVLYNPYLPISLTDEDPGPFDPVDPDSIS